MNYPIEGATVQISPYIADNFRNLGMAEAIYDLIDALGYRVKASDIESDEGDAFWSANQGRTVGSYEMPFWRNKEARRKSMTRCKLLDEWFDAKSKEVDAKEKQTKKCFVTGEKK